MFSLLMYFVRNDKNKDDQSSLKQVVVAAIVISSNICRAWTMYLCMDFVEFSVEAQGAFILWGRY